MVEEEFIIKNKTGLHARPASLFVKKANSFQSRIVIRKGKREVDAKSIISLLTLGAGKGDTITLAADGPDEEQALAHLIDMLHEFDD